MNKIFLILSGFLFCLVNGCSTPIPTGDTIVSVSWENPTPSSLSHLETTLCGSENKVYLETLPAYTEKAVETSAPVLNSCKVKTSMVAGGQPVSILPVFVRDATRKDPEGKYNLRIRLGRSGDAEVTLEPIRLTRERLGTR